MIHVKQHSFAGPNLIIIHGLFGNADNWHSIAHNLSKHFSIHCIDLPNHGKSDSMTNATYPKMAQAVLDWANTNNIDTFYLLGHSMGGKVAMQMASLAPTQIEKLIVVDIAPVNYQPSHTKILEGLTALTNTLISSRKEADTLLASYESNISIRQFLLKSLVKNENGYDLALSVDNLVDSYDRILKKPLIKKAVNLPTLFIKGETSDYIIADYQKDIQTAFPQASFKIISEAGHWLHAEKPIPFTSLVKRFLQQQNT